MFTRFHPTNLLLITAFTLLSGCAAQNNIQNKSTILPLNQTLVPSDLTSKQAAVIQDAAEIRSQLLTKEAIFLDSADAHQARMDRFTEKLNQKSQVSERKKINFLLDSIRHSSNGFFRNGTSYTAVQASEWLQWKSHRKRFRDHPIVTGQDFVSRVATRSNTTGESYQIVSPNGNHYKMGEILQNELSALEEAIRLKMTSPAPVLGVSAAPSSKYTASVDNTSPVPSTTQVRSSEPALMIPAAPSSTTPAK